MNTEMLERVAKTIRTLSIDAVQAADSGHPGMPMGCADLAAVLWAYHMKFDPAEPEWVNRDRFVLSAGHGSMLLYSLLHLFDFNLSLDQIKNFRQFGSTTPGHPEFGVTAGVETTTGPLGQGFANGVGIALSGKMLGARSSEELFNYRVYGIVSDGDLMEGVAAEAASLAGHLGLGNLIYLYDDNEISIGGSTDISFTEDVPARFKSYGWHVLEVDGHSFEQVDRALSDAQAEAKKPTLIVCRTTIAKGSPNKAGTADSHGAPLGEDEVKLVKEALQWPTEESFLVPEDVKSFCSERASEAANARSDWEEKFSAWQQSHGDAASQLVAQLQREIPESLKANLFKAFSEPKKAATRALSGEALQVIAQEVPGLIGGSADLEPSNKTLIKGREDIQAGAFAGGNLRFGVREHAMGSIINGLAYTKAWIPYTGTFLVFSDYMRPAMRLAALSHLQSLFIFTHDSFYVGEDGPTHQPIEHIAALRAIPNLYVFRPADGVEVASCYWQAVNLKDRPSTLLFTRQGLPPLEREAGFDHADIERGAYVVSGGDVDDLAIVATGSEVWVAQAAAALLKEKGHVLRVVSMPCVERFLEQDQAVRDQILPPKARKISLEAGITMGWSDIIGADGLALGINHYGASAPGDKLAVEFGFTPEAVARNIETWMSS